ncbi:hypothetical protein M407DRAFT_6527 [Tulasnella calospora MUT 4182]|uniref:Uncharacterized protein n=1 Tax=Tulasnella calospora MUT 4182 TaxID=1051891 RepID=A0A0C3QM93_9AGAM|nr:hypothetical protein M407DRAFT_6527 [Tulasnella calospora MUT 4182]
MLEEALGDYTWNFEGDEKTVPTTKNLNVEGPEAVRYAKEPILHSENIIAHGLVNTADKCSLPPMVGTVNCGDTETPKEENADWTVNDAPVNFSAERIQLTDKKGASLFWGEVVAHFLEHASSGGAPLHLLTMPSHRFQPFGGIWGIEDAWDIAGAIESPPRLDNSIDLVMSAVEKWVWGMDRRPKGMLTCHRLRLCLL